MNRSTDEIPWRSISELQAVRKQHRYLADRGLATALHLSVSLARPLFLEGEAGVGNGILAAEAIRLQCHEGIDASQALYDWNYAKQFLSMRADGERAAVEDFFSEDYLVERPLLRALRTAGRAVLLIDEIDRADDEFEAFLLELLADYSVTIPEIDTVRAKQAPVVILTSKLTRTMPGSGRAACTGLGGRYTRIGQSLKTFLDR